MKHLVATLTLVTAALPASAEIVLTYTKNPNEAFASPSDSHVLTYSSMKSGADKAAPWGVQAFSQSFAPGGSTTSTTEGKESSHAESGTGVMTSTLTLAKDSSYFGMWWAASDSANVLQFYEGSKLVGTFNTASLSGLLPDSVQTHATTNGQGPSAFINFFGEAGASWDKIVLTNNDYSSKSSDNAATRVVVYNPQVDSVLPGQPIATVNGSTTTKISSLPTATTAVAPATTTTPTVTEATPTTTTVTPTAPETTTPTATETTSTPVAAPTPDPYPIISSPVLSPALSAVSTAPGAPAPPAALLVAFAGALALRQVRQRRRSQE